MAEGILVPLSLHNNELTSARFPTFEDAASSYLASGGEARYLPPIVEFFGARPLHTIHPFDIRQMAEVLYPTHSEATALRWLEVDLSARSILLLKTKTSRNSTRSLTDDVVERLRLMQAGRQPEERVFRYSSRYSVNERLRAVCDRAGIPYKPPHTCGRHTFATSAIDLGVDVVTAMRAGDWKSSKVFLETYVHPRTNAARMVADRLNFNAMTDL